MNIKLDVRETKLIQLCKEFSISHFEKSKLNFMIEALPIGDIIIEFSGKEVLIIERKSAADLESSIKDGRYEEQSFRLSNSVVPKHNIVYLIEGPVYNKPNKSMLYSAMFSLNFYKGFSVLRSFSIDESAFLICNMAYKMQKEQKMPFYKEVSVGANTSDTDNVGETDVQKDESYCSVVKKVKKDNITPENISEIMLCQIPGISSVSALAIMAKFKTMSSLIESIKLDPQCLQGITYVNAKSQSRKISKLVIANIIKFLL